MSEIHKALVRAAIAAFNDPDARERYFDLYAPDVVLHGYPGDLQGRRGVRSFCAQLWAAFPDVRIDVDEILVRDDRVASRYKLRGNQSADFYGSPMSGSQTEVEGVMWLHFRHGLVVEAWQLFATLDTATRLSGRAAEAPPRHSASADAAALRWEEGHSDA